jgi:hypothetical protein
VTTRRLTADLAIMDAPPHATPSLPRRVGLILLTLLLGVAAVPAGTALASNHTTGVPPTAQEFSAKLGALTSRRTTIRRRVRTTCRHPRAASCRRARSELQQLEKTIAGERRALAASVRKKTKKTPGTSAPPVAATPGLKPPVSAAASGTAAPAASAVVASPSTAAPAAADAPAATVPAAGSPGAGATPSAPPPGTAPRIIYVAATGNDTAAGTSTAPLRTVTAALAKTVGGERIQVAAGSYPKITDSKARTKTVTIVGAGQTSTAIAGLEAFGAQHLDVSGFTINGLVRVAGHPSLRTAQPATDVDIHDNAITSGPNETCVMVRDAAQDIRIGRNWIHDCYSGIVGPGRVTSSRKIAIIGNTIERNTADAIQFGNWDDVTITGNVMRGSHDPAGVIHNDGIQFTGSSTHVVITGNRISDSSAQLIFIQDAVGPISDVLVQNNFLYDAGAVAMQSWGATGVRIDHNTIWKTNYGGLWLRAGYQRPGESITVPTDTVVTNNVVTTLKTMEGAAARAPQGNVTTCWTGQPQTTSVAEGWTCLPVVGFANEAVGDLQLEANSPARTLGTAVDVPATDIDGRVRAATTVPGAFR